MLVSLTSPRLLTLISFSAMEDVLPWLQQENVNMYSKATARVTNKKLSNTYCKGVRQDVTSVHFSSVFICDLKSHLITNHYYFADDLVLLIDSPHEITKSVK